MGKENSKEKKKRLILKIMLVFVSLAFIACVFTIAKLSLPFIQFIGKDEVCANTGNCQQSLTYEVSNKVKGFFAGRQVAVPQITEKSPDKMSMVLGEESSNMGEKRIYVDLATQTLSAFEGEKLFMRVLVSTGKWYKTPVGDFRIWVKIRSTRMSGGEGDDYYDLPNVPYTMYFEGDTLSRNRGFAIHGAYWHNNFGHPMSHGCINMRQTDVEKLYNWANPETTDSTTHSSSNNPGTRITIYGEAPL